MLDCVLILLIISVASLIRSMAGFGDALIGMPLLLMFLPLEQADSIVATYGLIIGLLMCRHHFHHLNKNYKELSFLLVSNACGVVFGALMLSFINTNTLVFLLGILLLIYPSLQMLKGTKLSISTWVIPSTLVGFVGGFLGGSINTNGPPFVVYGQLRRWEPRLFLAMCQPIFLLGNILNVLSYISFGIYNYSYALLTLASIPMIMLGLVLGNCLRAHIGDKFHGLVMGLIVLSGLLLLGPLINHMLRDYF